MDKSGETRDGRVSKLKAILWNKKQLKISLGLASTAFMLYFVFCLPHQLFDNPHSTIIEDRSGQLLSATIANDGQWRFPESHTVPEKFKKSLLAFEDRNFESHFGIYLPSIFRAFKQNIESGRVVSGGSTITMQIARMARNGNRNLFEKCIEMIWAIRMEIKYSKEELLNIYVSNAPFGGNVVGLEAAAWRYFSLPPEKLTWAQSATLAVLPNAPALIYPGKRQQKLLEKRNRVLSYLLETQVLDSTTYLLSLEEEIPQKPQVLPMMATHLLNHAIGNGLEGMRIKSSIDFQLQKQMIQLTNQYQQNLNSNYIHNSALLVLDLKKNEVLTYIGNTAQLAKHSSHVDLIQSHRSTGSILKPFLYASMLMQGELHNEMLIPDVPMHFKNFAPKNYVDQFDGAVPAKKALSRSLNVPAVYLLQKHGIQKFLHTLKKSGQTAIDKSSDYYGLSLILGGAESSLWDISKVYAGMAKCLNSYPKANLNYFKSDWEEPSFLLNDFQSQADSQTSATPHLFDRASIYLTFQALLDVNRPGAESAWKHFSSAQKIAWKTGTSFGNRDAWAIGITTDYLVGVWAGNASGEGRPGLVGANTAAPIMLNVFSKLKSTNTWFEEPKSELVEMVICKESGYRNKPQCSKNETILTHYMAKRIEGCSFHASILTDKAEQHRYYIDCAGEKELEQKTYFVLPPLQEWYYKKRQVQYKSLPPFHPDCAAQNDAFVMEIIYPKPNTELVLTKDLSKKRGEVVFELAHRDASQSVFWHVDDTYIGSTKVIHQISYAPKPGEHILYAVDENGNSRSLKFSVLEGE